jgi:hypothetical protein
VQILIVYYSKTLVAASVRLDLAILVMLYSSALVELFGTFLSYSFSHVILFSLVFDRLLAACCAYI